MIRPFLFSFIITLSLLLTNHISAQPSACMPCHTHYGQMYWPYTIHARTQTSVAIGLARDWRGYVADTVLRRNDCIACHAPTTIRANGGMTEPQALNYFFTTTNNQFTDSTRANHTADWQHVTCQACHSNSGSDNAHPHYLRKLFNSRTAGYDSVRNTSILCGKCHGALQFPNTEHRLYEAWLESGHGASDQAAMALQLANGFAGRTPAQVTGTDSTNCIACHAPTATKNYSTGISDATALFRLFSTNGTSFTQNTVAQDTANWLRVACNACHDPHHTDSLGYNKYQYYNSTIRTYSVFSDPDLQCGQCHGRLRFANAKYASYEILHGISLYNIPGNIDMPNTNCIDCHMHPDSTAEATVRQAENHAWRVFEWSGSRQQYSSACTNCHLGMSGDSAMAITNRWLTGFIDTLQMTETRIAYADTALMSNPDTMLLRNVREAKRIVAYVNRDESRGRHNHRFMMSLLMAAYNRASLALGVETNPTALPSRFILKAAYPNPFNASTTISYSVPHPANVMLKLYDIHGREVSTLVNRRDMAGTYRLIIDGNSLASGTYFLRLKSDTFSQTRKIVLLR